MSNQGILKVLSLAVVAWVALGATSPAAAQQERGAGGAQRPKKEAAAEAQAQSRAYEAPTPDRIIEITVTEKGFVPSSVTVRKGERVRLVVIRGTDETTVREFILDEYLFWRPLPLGVRVSETFTAGATGEFPFRNLKGDVTGTFIVVE